MSKELSYQIDNGNTKPEPMALATGNDFATVFQSAPEAIDYGVGTADEVIRRSSRSFSLAARLLPVRYREQVTALYAWCRSVDDTVDQACDRQHAEMTLQVLDEDLQRIGIGKAIQHPASSWIEPLIANRVIDLRHASELIEGMRMDLNGFHVETEADLERYCYHAAGTVGLMMTRLMGVQNRKADLHAIALGVAMQMTNIARDVREDAERGRSYLPGISDPLTMDPDEVKASVAKVLELAEQHYQTATDGMYYLPWNCRMSIRVAMYVYREIGRQIQRNQFEVLHQRTVLSKPRLLVTALLAMVASVKDDVQISTKRALSSVTFYTKEIKMYDPVNSQSLSKICTPTQAKQTVYLGLSLTLIMATALFAMVYVNPKSSEYSYLPLIYAGISLFGGVFFNRLAARCETTADAEAMQPADSKGRTPQ
jgi:15-cis-phytoene synthase